MKNNFCRFTMFFVVLIILSVLQYETTFANENKWYEEYSYFLEKDYEGKGKNYIQLETYKKTAKTITVPSKAVIDGVTYYTKIKPVGNDGMFYSSRKTLEKIVFEEGCIVESGNRVFAGLSKLKSVNVEALDMSQCEGTAWMFAGCTSLKKLNVKNWNMSNVTNMFNMFGACESLEKLDVSKWDTSNVTVMVSVFDHCKSLQKIPVENWDVSKVTTMSSMFYKCEKVDSLDLHKWDTSNVTDMWEMFGRCYNMRSINLKGFDTSKVTTMAGMFCCNFSLQSVDLSSFDMSNVWFEKYEDDMFIRCASLKKVKTPRNSIKKLEFNSGLRYRKKTGSKLSKKLYNYIPKSKKSIVLVCANKKSKDTKITSIKASKGKIKLKWKKIKASIYEPVEYEVQCSTNKKFSNAVGKMTNATQNTFSVQDNVTNKNSTTFKKLEKGKTYYVRVRVYTYEHLLSKWSKTRKIKVK